MSKATRTLKGQLLFDEASDKPLSNLRVLVFEGLLSHPPSLVDTVVARMSRLPLARLVPSSLVRTHNDKHIAEGHTDSNGHFEIPYPAKPNEGSKKLHIALVMRNTNYSEEEKDDEALVTRSLRNANRKLQSPFLSYQIETHLDMYDLGVVRLPMWKRREIQTQKPITTPTTRLLIDFPGEHWPEELQRAPWFPKAAAQQALASALFNTYGTLLGANQALESLTPLPLHKHVLHEFNWKIIETVTTGVTNIVDGVHERIYENLPLGLLQPAYNVASLFGYKNPFPYSVSDEDHVGLALNGFNPRLLKACDDGKTFYMDFSYKGVGLRKDYYVGDSTAFFERDGNTMKLARIDITDMNDRYSPSTKGTKASYTPKSPTLEWEGAKRIWRCNYFFFGEVTTHLTETHLNVEQYVLAVMRNLRHNPVYDLLTPHMYGTVFINSLADKILTSESGLVPKYSGILREDVTTAVQAHAKTMNWEHWRPRVPLTEGHQFAHQQCHFWQVLEEYVTYYFNTYGVNIEKHWDEIYRMSQELVQYSVEYSEGWDKEPWQDMNEVNQGGYLPPAGGKKASQEPNGEGAKADGKKATTAIKRRAVSLVTPDEKITPANREKNMANLKQLCKYVIFHATFRHKHINDAQYELGGIPGYATLGLQEDPRRGDNGDIISDESRVDHKNTTYALVNVKYGYIMADEDKNMHPKLKELLKREKSAFAKMGLDIYDIRSCINI
eukprot:TRINITY_DN335_c0_g2_i1.p1 TRINITY_DN335_c0_g2~~TRINITY_DN335_c0_g2_i1.p1  ORF type:complete len:725 (+),score=316.91 TRINITY_DN335_c0_g2_i1:72-2246(+)